MLIEAPELSSFARVRHAFFTRQGGVSEGLYASLNGGLGSGDDQALIAENRGRMADALGILPERLISLHQIHSADAVAITAPWPRDARPRADGVATATPGIGLAVATADCGPVLFADPEAGVIGACHAGWKGALGGVVEATIARMCELGARRQDITAVLGPTISAENYEVGPDFVAAIGQGDPAALAFLRPASRDTHRMFDLPGYIGSRLAASGIGVAARLDLCTYADESRFFSYRRTIHRGEPDYGRLISAIALGH